MTRVTFYFDLGSPYAYLAAERLHTVVDAPVQWQPVLLGGLFKLAGRGSWALGDYERRQTGMAEIERRARQCGLPPLRWPDPWPSDYLFAMRVATYAFGAGGGPGLGEAFARAAYRSAFAEGAQLSLEAPVLAAAAAVGLDPAAARAAAGDPAVKEALRSATEAAYELGVFGVPTVAVGDELFWGDDRLEDVAAYLRGAVTS